MKRLFLFLSVLTSVMVLHAEVRTLTLDKKESGPIAPTMYGIFLEDINFAADGGLYAELIENRSFEFPQALQGWDVMGVVTTDTLDPAFPRNPHYATLHYPGHHCEATGLENHGYFGLGLRAGIGYLYKIHARLHAGEQGEAKLLVELVDTYQNVLDSKTFSISNEDWQAQTCTFTTPRTVADGYLRMRLLGDKALDIDHVSLIPNDHLFSLRRDLVEALHDLHPGIFRFPGGCIVEGTQLESRYNWKNSVGPVENRPLNKNRWNNTFEGRYAPDYYQSYGLGFYEYFLLAEYIGASPIPVVNVGLSCQFHNTDESAYVPVEELMPYIQDALDLIEFANGDVSTTWGALRAKMGHPAPFNMKIIGIGNEQWGEPYPKRLEPFLKAIRAQYPDIEVVGTPGPYPDGELFDYGWKEMRRLKADYVDEHYYKSPEWFLANATRYDNYDRKGPKVFAGEYAAHIEPAPALRAPGNKNTFSAALAEAAFMTGLERNADVVRMTAYAPLLAHARSWQWDPDLIWFDNLHVIRTANYYVQQLYAGQPGTNRLGITENKKPLTGQNGLYASAAYDKTRAARIIRLVNTADVQQNITITCPRTPLAGNAEVQRLHADLADYNDLTQPNRVRPERLIYETENGVLNIELQPKTFYVITIFD